MMMISSPGLTTWSVLLAIAIGNDGIHLEDDDDRTLPEVFITNSDPKTTDNMNESTDSVINDQEIEDNSNSKNMPVGQEDSGLNGHYWNQI